MKRALLIAAIVALRSAFGAGGVGDMVVELADEITSKEPVTALPMSDCSHFDVLSVHSSRKFLLSSISSMHDT